MDWSLWDGTSERRSVRLRNVGVSRSSEGNGLARSYEAERAHGE